MRPNWRIGGSAGLFLRHVGFVGKLAGNWPRAALIAACTSRAAASIFRLRSNCKVIPVEPRLLEEVISFSPAIRPNCRSSGVATEDAIVSGLAPGRFAFDLKRGEIHLWQRRDGKEIISDRAGHTESYG